VKLHNDERQLGIRNEELGINGNDKELRAQGLGLRGTTTTKTTNGERQNDNAFWEKLGKNF